MSETEFANTIKAVNASSSAAGRKTALVVDDSKMARYVLKEMLIEQGIKVETAESAEEALGALAAYMPDVIFMDHMMPGMDGFQAVQVIKNDPRTSKIPILMYTSKDEGVYVNQARALGAVGVLPKKLKPVQLERVLQQLKLIPSPQAIKEKLQAQQQEQAQKEHQAKQERIIKETQHSLEELARSASEDLEKDSMRQLFRQLFVEQRDSIKQDQNEILQSLMQQVQPTINELTASNKRWQKISATMFVLLIFPLYFFMPNLDSVQQSIFGLKQHQTETVNTFLQNIPKPTTTINENTSASTDWSILEWSLNQNNQLEYAAQLNSPVTINRISDLVTLLDASDYRGSLSIQYHAGNYCEAVQGNQRSLMTGQASLSQCQFSEQLINLNDTSLQDMRIAINNLNDEYAGIEIGFEEMGFDYTLEDYPVPSAVTSVQKWNRIAAFNHRLQFQLNPF